MPTTSRRTWLQHAAVAPGMAGVLCHRLFAADRREPLPVAAVVTAYKPNSHADVFVGKVLEGYKQDGGPGPALKVVSMYTDQVPNNDMSRALAAKHGFRIARTIDEAITLGSDKVQVAGVLSIGEHGDYPYTPDTHQHMYPRRRFFDDITVAFRRCNQVVPIFSDKHLAYQWSDARHIYDTSREMKIPLMAGSSLPVAWREPPTVVPVGCEIEDVLAVGYGGSESYGFHALEMLQCIVERRRGGETGVSGVRSVQGDEIWRAEQRGRWSRELLSAALAAMPDVREGKPEERLSDKAAFYLVDYRDGLKVTVAMAQGLARHFGIAVKLRGRAEPVAIWFKLQDDKPYGHFEFLVKAVEHMIHTGRPAYPVERTLLTTGILYAAMHSLAAGGRRKSTPELAVRYAAADWPFANQPSKTTGERISR